MERIIEKLNEALRDDLGAKPTMGGTSAKWRKLGYEVDGYSVTVFIEPIDKVEGETTA